MTAPGHLRWSLLVGLVCVATSTPVTAQDSSLVVVGPGVVFVHGERVYSPYEFTGLGGDTLRLNGFPISPLRPKLPLSGRTATVPDSISLAIDRLVDEVYSALRELEHLALAEWKQKEMLVDLFRASSLVQSARVEGGRCLVQFVNSRHEIIFSTPRQTTAWSMLVHPTSSERSKERHAKMVELVRSTIEHGGIQVIEHNHRLTVPRSRAPAARDLLLSARAGLWIPWSRENPAPFDHAPFVASVNRANGHFD